MPDYRIRIVADPSGVRPGTNAVERRLRKTEVQANRLRTSLSRLFALAGGGLILTRTIGTYAKFEQRIASVAAVSRATAGELALLREETRRLGATTRFTAVQAAEGAELLARAGFDANQTLEALEGTLRLAQAGELGLAQAASVTTSILKGFQLEVDQTARVVDVLAKGAASANTTVAGLGEAAKFVAPIAKSMNVSLEETTAAILALSNAGLQGSLAGTGLRRVLSELINPGKALQSALNAAGKTADDVNPRFNKLTDILKTLREVGIGKGQATAIFQQRGGPAFQVLQEFIPAIEKFTVQLQNAEGFAEQMAKTMDDNLNGALLAVKSAFEAVTLSMGEFEDENLEGFFRGMATALRALAKDITVFANVIESLVTLLAIKLAKQAIGAVIVAMARLKVAILTNPIGLIATGITLATAALVGFADQIVVSQDGMTTLQDVGVGAWEALLKAAREVMIFLDAFFIGLRQVVKDTFGVDIGQNFEEFAKNAALAFDAVIGAGIGFVNGMVILFSSQKMKNIGITLEAIFKTTAMQIRIAWKKIAEFFTQLFDDPIATIAKQFKRLVGAIAGVAAVLRSMGVISEDTRVAIDDAVTSLENLAGAGKRRGKTPGEIEIENLEKARDAYIEETKNKIKVGQEETFEDLAAMLRAANAAAFVSFTFFEDTIDTIYDRAEQSAADRERKRIADFQAKKKAQEAERKKSLGLSKGDPGEPLSKEAAALLATIDLTSQLAAQEKLLLEIYQHKTDLVDEVTQALIELKLKELEASTALEDGFTRAFIRLSQEAEDWASVMEASVNTFVDRSSDALASFVRNGELSFKDLANAILDDLARIFARLLIIQALNIATGGAASLAGIGLQAGASAAQGQRANGGPVHPGREYLVGERGQERVRFGQSGHVERSEGKGERVTVVNVQDPDEIPNAMNTPEGERVVLNIMQRNRGLIKRMN
jgi:TP901 family phage tail tape measure protein